MELHAWIRQSTTAIQMAAAADPVFTTATILLPPQQPQLCPKAFSRRVATRESPIEIVETTNVPFS